MNVRLLKPEDVEQVKSFASEHKLEFNTENRIVLVAPGNDGKINGVLGIRSVAFIEPMISDNSLASIKLFVAAMQILEKLEQPIVRCFTEVEHKELFEKVGFDQVFTNQIAMEKIIGVKK